MIVVVLEETFTPAEKTLIARGEADKVRSFLSETDLENDISVELFILAPLPGDADGP